MGLEVNCRCYSSREGWHENVIIKAVSVSQGRRLTQNHTARQSRSVAVVDCLLPHFDTFQCLRHVLLNTAATATYFVGHCGHCHVYCWTQATVHCQVYAFGRCLRSDMYFVGHTGNCHIFCWTHWELPIYFVGHTGNCHEFVGHRRLFTVRCILLDTALWGVFCSANWQLSCILLSTLTTVIHSVGYWPFSDIFL